MKAVKAFYRHPEKRNVYCTGGIAGSKYTEWKVGDEKRVEGEISLCGNGFHFFRTEDLCFGNILYDSNMICNSLVCIRNNLS